MSTPAEVARALEALGVTVPAPTEHPLSGAAEARWVAPARIAEACRVLRDAGYFFESMTCLDRLKDRSVFELIYTFNRWDAPSRVALRVWVPQGQSVPTVSGVFGAANWNEREAWEFYGLTFEGHPNLTWLLLPEGTEFKPLLKSFTAPPASVYDDSLTAPAPAPAAAPAHDDPTAHH